MASRIFFVPVSLLWYVCLCVCVDFSYSLHTLHSVQPTEKKNSCMDDKFSATWFNNAGQRLNSNINAHTLLLFFFIALLQIEYIPKATFYMLFRISLKIRIYEIELQSELPHLAAQPLKTLLEKKNKHRKFRMPTKFKIFTQLHLTCAPPLKFIINFFLFAKFLLSFLSLGKMPIF